MAKSVQVLLTCDYDEKPTVAVETITFGHDGASYEADMCQVHLDEYNAWINEYVVHSRKLAGSRGRRVATTRAIPTDGQVATATRRRPGGDNLAAIREWGRANGYQVSDRGRISVSVRSAYEAART
ncbi:MAG: histone-like nucleoid-structuring protein Lsr2 [Acidimicrobiales bacterium]